MDCISDDYSWKKTGPLLVCHCHSGLELPSYKFHCAYCCYFVLMALEMGLV